MKKEMEKTYKPQEFESRIYSMWLEKHAFDAEVNPEKTPYTIVLPPPNITGSLHEGHALNHTMQDILIRSKRMQGYEALWLPGTDHASIATEVKILDKIFQEEGRTKDDLTREEFLEKAWEWKETYGDHIFYQMQKLGNSCDWRRMRFTMDDVCNRAVTESFVRYYEEGYIYRGERLINWCPVCGTAISDAEVDHEEKQGNFYTIRYPMKDSDDVLRIATTRPETMLGDTAIAVHPEDSRYTHLIGKFAILPLVGREIPIIADSYVDRELGTGALKVTPAHDPNDYEIGMRHDLPIINIFDERAQINEEGGVYQGLDRYEARKKIVEDLKTQGFLEEIKQHDHNVGHCYRCHREIEPRISLQWFVAMDELAKKAKESVEKGEMKFAPERFVKIYNNWLDNIRDWNISRQLWWGHRIPAWYCEECDHITVAREEPLKCAGCGSEKITRDPDVLDTWFSSALWPLSTMGWPEETETLKYFYPTDVLATGYDIIFFWVVRMMFSGLHFLEERPFHTTLINGLVRDAQGRKISKSLNNGTDPIEVIDEYGADALRFMLVSGTALGNDTRFSIDRVESARNFANKLWNASRFVLGYMKEELPPLGEVELDLSDRWILHRSDRAIEEVTDFLDKYELGMAADRIQEFLWNEYCDWYIEMSKVTLTGDDEEAGKGKLRVLLSVLEDALKLLHPFMPFITEEIWGYLPKREELLVRSPWPALREASQEGLAEMNKLMEAVGKIRNLRAEMKIPHHKKGRILLEGEDSLIEVFLENKEYFRVLSSMDQVDRLQEMPDDTSVILLDGIRLILPLSDLIDYEKEKARLEKEIERLISEVKRTEGKLANQGFVTKAPAELVRKEEEKLSGLQERLEQNSQLLAEVKKKIR
ncbi:MAG: valine--tRNA ligase [Tissierellia bacterium]|nr:valine--tRNA ligase [Bacillota bacterium]NLL23278.1 valine--tRNA ligase [Tissierellia bacterium]